MASENSKLPRDFSQMEMMRMMFGEEFLLASNNFFEESNEESDIFKDVFFKNGIETVSQTGFEIISGGISDSLETNLEENIGLNSQNEILEPHPLEFETLGFSVEDHPINRDTNFISENGNYDHEIISQNGSFGQDIISQNGSFGRDIISQNGNFDLQNGNLSGNHNMYMGPSEVDLYATIGGNLGTSSDNFIESDPLEFDQDIALHSESTDEEETEEPVYGNMGMENERNIMSGPLDYDLHTNPEIHDHTYAFSGETNKDSGNREPKSLSKDLSDQLRVHANRVLTEYGWQIDPRKRSDRTKLACYYKYPPKDLIFTTFSKAWRTCGEILAIHSPGPHSSEVKEWSDVSTFWVDLAETMSRLWVGQSLGEKWRVLDPFVAVVCIDKKVHVLRNRGVIRVVNGECVVVSEGRRKREKINEEREYNNDTIIEGSGGKSNKGRRVKRKKCACGEKDCNDGYNDNNVGLVECKYRFGVNEGNNNGYDDEKMELKMNDSVDLDNLDYEILRSPMETKLVNNSIKKARKRSKRISEIDAPGANGESGDIKPPKKPRSSETKPKARRWPKTELPENDFPEKSFPGNGFLESHFQENGFQENSLNESGLTKSTPDSLTISTNSSNLIENEKPSQNEINNNDNANDPPKAKRRGRKPKKSAGATKPKNGYKRPRGFHIYDDDLLITAIMKNKDFNSSGKFASSSNQNPKKKYKMRTLRKTPKRKFQLALRNKGGVKGKKKKNSSFDSRRLILARKTVLSWLIATGGVALNEIIQYRNLKNSEVLKEGWVTLEGILCSCCNKIMSLTEFKTHAGPRCQRNNGNLFLQSGKSFTLCQLEAWGAEYRLRKGVERVSGSGSGSDKDDQNDDTCALCGDGGELLCCDKCPNTYHPACLPSQEELPEGSWYCWHCICQSCGNAVGGKTDISTTSDLKCLQCEDSYHDTCIGGITCDGDGTWFCGMSCQEIHQWLRSHVGVANFFDDGLSWTLLRSNHEEQKVHSTQKIALMAECNTKLAVALTLMEECFVPMVDPRTGIDMIPHVVYNRGSNFARLDYKGFYTVVLEKGDDIVSVASIRIHGNRIAEMPLVATNTEYRRKGMCRRLLDTIERMLRSFRVKLLVLSAIPDLVETWVTGFGFKPIQDNEKQLLNNITLMLFPGSSILTKNLIKTQISGCKMDMYEREDEMNIEENNYHNFEDLTENSNFKLEQSENGIMNLDIRTINPESSGAPVDRQLANLDHPENDEFL